MLAYDKEGWGMAETRAGGPAIALVGNPNVGKSTVFNALTGLKQHTGNWPGKTVSTARGEYTYHGRRYTLVDLPGTYSLTPGSAASAAAAYRSCHSRKESSVHSFGPPASRATRPAAATAARAQAHHFFLIPSPHRKNSTI